MRLTFILLTAMMFACVGLGQNAAQAQSAKEIIKIADPSVGLVFKRVNNKLGGLGTGFVVSSVLGERDLFFITNHHVIKGGNNFVVGFLARDTKHFFDAEVIYASRHYDLALLQLTVRRDAKFVPKPLKIARRTIVKGEASYAIGFPSASDVLDREGKNEMISTFSSGSVSRVFEGPFVGNGRLLEIVQHTTTINQGNSGGPLLDSCANIIGVNTFFVSNANNTYAASSSNTLGKFLNNISVPYTAVRAECNGLDVETKVRPVADVDKADGVDWQSWAIPAGVIGGVILLFGVIFVVAKTSASSEPKSQNPRPSAAKSAAIVLKAAFPDGSQQDFKVTSAMLKSGVTIGKLGAATFGINAGKVSRKHLRIYQDGRKLMAMDLGSTNGTKVNGKTLLPNVATQINSSSVIHVAGVKIVLKI